jgi:hypothetical protein
MVLSIVVNELSTVRYGLLFWLGGPEVRPGQKSFTTHRESGYAAVWTVLLFVLLIETVGLHFLLWRWSPVAAFIATGLSIYSIVFFVADLASMAKRPIVFITTSSFSASASGGTPRLTGRTSNGSP